MKLLSQLLERFSQSLSKDIVTKEIIGQIILEKTKVNLKKENFNLKGGVLEIFAFAIAKSEIALKEEIIKDELRARQIFVSRIFYK